MNLDFGNKVVVITGAGLGIGRAAARMFAKHGAKVAVIDLNEDHARNTVEAIGAEGGTAAYFVADVSQEEQVKNCFRGVLDKWGRVDVLINNAGIYYQGKITDTPLAVWEKVMAVNVRGAYLCAREAVAIMEKQGGGVIINVASEAGLVGIKGQVVYNVSKAALIGLTRSLAVDHAPAIRVNCLCPGTTATPLVEESVRRSGDAEKARRELEQIRPMNRLGLPDEQAAALLFLASHEISYATGAVLCVDGGYTAQ
ncbi:SDR family NAD(P)-dependent oxidoreductase [Thermanaeromonas sp. C210]|uniref:SDR family NAD(P)-dependent oxidoreductase n=1 Tax=Thermanaeromonas sp. C210 TaxID=2731925 RepID=UPI00155D2130|nr:glucose 1-dehydrogenase [Thermanaeromonas sp. C210]GFN22586.1 oxidoreductase [Thermanaeromonas sp. C210]